jgi:hypothetical protein
MQPDSVGTFRILINAPAADGRLPVTFTLRDPKNGETAIRMSSFIGPSGTTGAAP